MKLATTMNNRVQLLSATPITDDGLRTVAPSIFANEAHISRSARYGYVPTIDVISALRREGFQPFFVAQSKTRDPGKRDYTKHMIRLRHESITADKEVPEIILINSHDGTTSYQMIGGVFVMVCCNGLAAGDCFGEIRIQHSGNVVDRVIDGAFEVLEQSTQVMRSVKEMKAITLSDPEQEVFASAALVARYGEETIPGAHPITTTQVLRPRRTADNGRDLWTVFNRTQENLVQGGLHGRTANNRRTSTRGVTGISQNVQLNRALWTLTDQMMKLKSA